MVFFCGDNWRILYSLSKIIPMSSCTAFDYLKEDPILRRSYLCHTSWKSWEWSWGITILLDLFFDPGDEGDVFLQNFGWLYGTVHNNCFENFKSCRLTLLLHQSMFSFFFTSSRRIFFWSICIFCYTVERPFKIFPHLIFNFIAPKSAILALNLFH